MNTSLPPKATEHSPLGPSGYHRWAHCLDSVHAQQGLPETTSVFAAQGTLFHTIIAILLARDYLEAWDFLAEERVIDGHLVKCDPEMVKHLTDARDYIDSQHGQLFVEKRVSLDKWLPGEWGTTDVGLLFRKKRKLKITDWKYGAQPVDAFENEQLQLYLLGFWNWLVEHGYIGVDEIEEVELEIRQPRIEGGGSTWTTTLDHILKFGVQAGKMHALAKQKGNKRTPGLKTCQWCRAQKICKPYNEFVLDLVGQKLETLLDEPEPQLAAIIDPRQRSYIIEHWPMIKKWFNNLHTEALHDALKGRPTPHMKAIEGRAGKRQWRDVEQAKRKLLRLLGDEAVIEVPLSPTEAEKRLTKAEYEELRNANLIFQEDGKPVLVHESVRGKPVKNYDEKLLEMSFDREED